MMNSPVILVDMDSTAYDLTTPWLQWNNETFNDDISLEDLKVWDWEYASKGGKDVYKFLDIPGSFLNLKPYPGAVEAMKVAQAMGVTQVFATTCKTVQGAWEKMQAVERDFPFIGLKRVLVTGGAKQFFKGDLLVDDGPHNIKAFEEHNENVLTCVYDMPYNRETPANFRITNWSEYLDVVQYLIEWKQNGGTFGQQETI